MDNFLIAKATNVGVTRTVNEDSMTVFDSPNGQVLAVCDGMGGQAAGDVASQLSVNIIENILTDNIFESPEEAIRRSIMAANQGVLNRTAQNPELEGMGSTCVMLIIKNGKVHCGWVGDSRIYYISNHTIRQISHDQSYVQQLIDSGQITAEEAAHHPQKSEILNCIGLQGMTVPETISMPITPEPGSVFLLCSDGLSGMVDNAHIERVISNEGLSLQEKAEKLIFLANEAGGEDNITVELVQFGNSETVGATSGTLFETPKGVDLSKKPNRKWWYAVIAILVVALCSGGGIWYYYHNQQKEQNKEEQGSTIKPQNTNTKPVTKPTTSNQTPNKTPQTSKPKQTNTGIIENINSGKGNNPRKGKNPQKSNKKEEIEDVVPRPNLTDNVTEEDMKSKFQ